MRTTTNASKQLNEVKDIILNNMKGGTQPGGHIRQIRDLGSNPGSRERVQKVQNIRPGDETTIIMKQKKQTNQINAQAAERFAAPGSIVRGAPKIALGAPMVMKNGATGNGTTRHGITRQGGS